MIVDAKSYLDPGMAESKMIFTFSVQGPIVDLPKRLSRLVTQRLRFRVRGTGLFWLDYDQKKSNTIKVRSIARRKLLLQETNLQFDCASCNGSLRAADSFYLLGMLAVCILCSAMLPAIVKVAAVSGNGVGHVFAALARKETSLCAISVYSIVRFFVWGERRDGTTLCAKVTAIYVTLPLVAVAALLHFPVAWLIQRLYRRTSFSEALDEYQKQINCKPFPGPDGTHPRNQGLQVLTLRSLWVHFESFSLFSPATLL